MNVDIENLTPVTRVGMGGSGISKKIEEAAKEILARDNGAGITEIADAAGFDKTDKKVMANLANHLYVIRKRGVLQLAGAQDGEKVYVLGDGEKKKSKKNKK